MCQNVDTHTHRPEVNVKSTYTCFHLRISFFSAESYERKKEKHISQGVGLNSHLHLDCTSWFPQWFNIPLRSFYIAVSLQNVHACPIMVVEVAGTERKLYNTPRPYYLFYLLPFLLPLSTISASSYFALSSSRLPPCHPSAHASVLSHRSPFSPSRPSLLIYPRLPPPFSSSPLSLFFSRLELPRLILLPY